MRNKGFYVLCRDDLLRIRELCESLGLAIDGIMRRRSVEPGMINTYSEVRRYRQKVHASLKRRGDMGRLEDLF